MRNRMSLWVAMASLFFGALFAGSAWATPTAVQCTWRADPKPWLAPGENDLDDEGQVDSTAPTPPYGDEVTFREQHWKVIVHAGYMYGKAWAWDDVTNVLKTGRALVDRSGARGGFYNVVSVDRCIPMPPHLVDARTSCQFDTSVSTDSPGYAESSGMTHVRGTLTGVEISPATGCHCGSEDGSNAVVKYSYTGANGNRVEVSVTLQWGSDRRTSSASMTAAKSAPVLDEEYSLDHDLHVRAMGDGDLFNWTGAGLAKLSGHTLTIWTTCTCSNCGAQVSPLCIIDANSEQCTED